MVTGLNVQCDAPNPDKGTPKKKPGSTTMEASMGEDGQVGHEAKNRAKINFLSHKV